MSSDSNIFEAMWNIFPSLEVKRLGGNIMHYWLNAEELQGIGHSSDLIMYGDGTCGSWASLFLDLQRVHGITGSKNMGIFPPDGMEEIGIKTNLPAQGNAHPKANFIDHNVVERNGIIYDPSYGKTFTNRLAWENESVSVFYLSPNAQNPTNDVKDVLQTIWRDLDD